MLGVGVTGEQDHLGVRAGLPDLFEDAAGPIAPMLAYVLFTTVMNLAYFGGAILIGRTSTRSGCREMITSSEICR